MVAVKVANRASVQIPKLPRSLWAVGHRNEFDGSASYITSKAAILGHAPVWHFFFNEGDAAGEALMLLNAEGEGFFSVRLTARRKAPGGSGRTFWGIWAGGPGDRPGRLLNKLEGKARGMSAYTSEFQAHCTAGLHANGDLRGVDWSPVVFPFTVVGLRDSIPVDHE